MDKRRTHPTPLLPSERGTRPKLSVYPASARGNEGNLEPYAMVNEQPKSEPLIALPGDKYDFSIAAPFGMDSYLLLTRQEAIDPSVFTAEGVRTRGALGGGADALSQMLSDRNTGTRAAKRAETPGTWSIEIRTIRSV